jgi:RHH-type transcriptional regulator, proline utilization regulon repressor / proline dehydrogenase / delta 1-pyrroline-5-carboxylate dehydrogenase
LEQAVGDVVASAFQSAGQRCSACRIVCIQDDVAADFEALLAGAIGMLEMGEPARLSTDVGPIIDSAASRKIRDYIIGARKRFAVIGEAHLPSTKADDSNFVAPIALRVGAISDVEAEIFGPVLHVVHFKAGEIIRVVAEINALGFGLTLGLHSRIDARIQEIAAHAYVGNIYVNRNQIGAVVGVQPFGGEGLSGTGPKAGGPHYLLRLSQGAYTGEISAEIALPGPTGETNVLRLVPRGLIACLGGDKDGDVSSQISVALAANCRALVRRSDLTGDTYLQDPRVIIMEAGNQFALLDQHIDGVLAAGSLRETVAQAVAQRDGAMIPLLSADTDPWRLYHERTLTIDTTAAGGNASLLAMRG